MTIADWNNQDYSGLSWEVQHITCYSTPRQPVICTASSTKRKHSHVAWKRLQRKAESYSGRQRSSSALLCPGPGMGVKWGLGKATRRLWVQGVGKEKSKATSFDNSVIMPNNWHLVKKDLWWRTTDKVLPFSQKTWNLESHWKDLLSTPHSNGT